MLTESGVPSMPPMSVRVATYNVQDLFLCGEREPAKQARALNYLRRIIRRLNAQILCLQEVGSEASLQALNSGLKEPFPYQGFVAGNSTRDIHVAYLSRWPLQLHSNRDELLCDAQGAQLFDYVDSHAAANDALTPLKPQRDFLCADVDLGQWGTLRCINVHLKARTQTRPWAQLAADVVRQAEARALAKLLSSAENSTANVLLAGDFNDTWHSDSLQPLTALNLHDALGERLRADGRNPSTYWRRRRTRIDFLLMNPHSVRNWQPMTSDILVHREAQLASDHYPVWLDLHWRTP